MWIMLTITSSTRVLTSSALALFMGLGTVAKAEQNPLPLPSIPTLMNEVQDHQRQSEKLRENYTYHELQLKQEQDSDGQIKSSELTGYEVIFVKRRPMRRMVTKNGKPLSANDQKKEMDKITKKVEKASGDEGDQSEIERLSVSRLLTLVDASEPRRETMNGRSTIVFNFTGKKKAKSYGMLEDLSKKLAGTLWVDEKDRQVARMDAHFIDSLRIGGGLLASIQPGTNFSITQSLVNGECWLPKMADFQLNGRILLFKKLRQHIRIEDSAYHRFKATANEDTH